MSGRAEKTAAFVHDFWSWWSDELFSMLPSSLRGEATLRDRFDIFLENDQTIVETVSSGAGKKLVDENSLEKLGEESWRQIALLADRQKPRLFLNQRDFLVIPFTLPKASAGRLESAIELQLPALAPLEAHLIDWNYIELGRSDTHIELLLFMAKSERLDAFESLFAAQDLMPPELCLRHEDQIITLRKPLEFSIRPLEEKKMLAAVAAIAMLAMIPILTIAGASLMIGLENDRIARLENELAPRLAEERAAARDEKLRRLAAPLFQIPSASNRLEKLAKAMPGSDWTVEASQGADKSFSFVADMKTREGAEESFEEAGLEFSSLDAESIETPNARVRVRYQVGR